jgi:hypothetical protein
VELFSLLAMALGPAALGCSLAPAFSFFRRTELLPEEEQDFSAIVAIAEASTSEKTVNAIDGFSDEFLRTALRRKGDIPG